MIYVFANDDCTLTAYASSEQAVAACEGIDVEDGNYRFFTDQGSPLTPTFTKPNFRGAIVVVSGAYRLEPSRESHSPHLQQILTSVRAVEGCGLTTLADVAAKLPSRTGVTAHIPPNKSLERTRDG